MEIFRALAVLVEHPGPEQLRLGKLLELPGVPTRREHAELFDFQLWPYASVYVGLEGMLGGEARDRVAGFWRALRLTPPAEPDHLAVLLALYANLCDRDADESNQARRLLVREARRALLWEHLLPWILPYLAKLEEVASPFYRGWTAMLRGAVLAEAQTLGPCDAVPLHLRDDPGLADPAVEGAEAFIRGILAPARSGMIIVGADLARAAHALGTGLRIGERRFVLEALLSQEPEGTLSWLAAESRAWVARHETWGAGLRGGVIAAVWKKRAEDAAALLERLSQSAALTDA
jgi:hypothetical protein